MSDPGNANPGTANTGTANTGTANTGTANTGTANTGTANTGSAGTANAQTDPKADPAAPPHDPRARLDQAMDSLNEFALNASRTPVSPAITDAVTQALVLILGSGPSVAAYDSLLQAQAANGQMFQNAVAHQQQTNILGMAMTAKCVRYMLDGGHPPEVDDVLAEEKAES